MNAGHDSDKILDHTRQQLSALIDGELSPDEAAFLMRRLQHDDELAGCWERWQLAGAVMRGQAGLRVPDGFSARVRAAVAREAAPAAPGSRRRWLHWGGGAIAASVALVALFLSRPAGPPPVEPTSTPVLAQTNTGAVPAPARQTPVPAPSAPDSAAQVAAAVAVADVPRRIAHARRGGGQSQRAVARAHERAAGETPVVAIAAAGDVVPATVPANPANPFSTRHPLPATRPWPRALVPGMPASGAFTVDYGGTATPSPGFYPFEPARLQPQPTEPLPEAP